MTTLKIIEGNFKSIADANAMINTYQYGEIWDMATSGTINYPMLFVSPEGSTAKMGEVGFKYRMFAMDLVQKEKRNEVDASSDTHQILLDVIVELFKGGQQATGGDYAFELKLRKEDIPITDFNEKHDDEVTGHFCDVTLWVEWEPNRCQIPT